MLVRPLRPRHVTPRLELPYSYAPLGRALPNPRPAPEPLVRVVSYRDDGAARGSGGYVAAYAGSSSSSSADDGGAASSTDEGCCG